MRITPFSYGNELDSLSIWSNWVKTYTMEDCRGFMRWGEEGGEGEEGDILVKVSILMGNLE